VQKTRTQPTSQALLRYEAALPPACTEPGIAPPFIFYRLLSKLASALNKRVLLRVWIKREVKTPRLFWVCHLGLSWFISAVYPPAKVIQ